MSNLILHYNGTNIYYCEPHDNLTQRHQENRLLYPDPSTPPACFACNHQCAREIENAIVIHSISDQVKPWPHLFDLRGQQRVERNRWNLRQIESVFAQNQVVASNKIPNQTTTSRSGNAFPSRPRVSWVPFRSLKSS